jgi:hypothetical protein
MQLTAGQGCHSYWYWSSWGYYWGGYWYYIPPYAVTQPVVGTAACGKWNTVLALSFIGSWLWFASGAVVCLTTPESSNGTFIYK